MKTVIFAEFPNSNVPSKPIDDKYVSLAHYLEEMDSALGKAQSAFRSYDFKSALALILKINYDFQYAGLMSDSEHQPLYDKCSENLAYVLLKALESSSLQSKEIDFLLVLVEIREYLTKIASAWAPIELESASKPNSTN